MRQVYSLDSHSEKAKNMMKNCENAMAQKIIIMQKIGKNSDGARKIQKDRTQDRKTAERLTKKRTLAVPTANQNTFSSQFQKNNARQHRVFVHPRGPFILLSNLEKSTWKKQAKLSLCAIGLNDS